jgi:hypothetical protein
VIFLTDGGDNLQKEAPLHPETTEKEIIGIYWRIQEIVVV